MSVNIEWAEALVEKSLRRENTRGTHQNEGTGPLHYTAEQKGEKVRALLERVTAALQLPEALALVSLAAENVVVQVSRSRKFNSGRRWCVISLHVDTLDLTVEWFSTCSSGHVYRDGVGLEGRMVHVPGALVDSSRGAQQFDADVRALFGRESSVLLTA